MKKVFRLIVIVLTLVSFTAAFADVGGTNKKSGNRSQIPNYLIDALLDDTTLGVPQQNF